MEVFYNHMREHGEAVGRPAMWSGKKSSSFNLPVNLSSKVVAVKEKVDKYVVEKNALSVHSLFKLVKLSQI